MYIDKKAQGSIFGGSVAIFIAVFIITLLTKNFSISTAYYIPIKSTTNLLLGLGLLLALVPPAVVGYTNSQHTRTVGRNIPKFLTDILQATDSGMTLPASLAEAAKSDYGPISKEIGIAMTKFSMGYDFKHSLAAAAKRLHHPRAPQLAMILSEAYSAGGKVHDVLTSSSGLYATLEEYEEDRQTQLRPYTLLVYISLGVYFIVVFISMGEFLNQVTKLVGSVSTGSSFLQKPPPLSYYASIFFWTGVFESVFGGLVAGKISDNSGLTGLRHSVILLGITLLFFWALVFPGAP
jgi:hypothetical protein